MKLKTIAVLCFLAGGAVGLGCGGGDPCTQKGSCSKDSAPSQAEINACENAISNGKCAGQLKSFLNCLHDNEQCKNDGSEDFDATEQKCPNQAGDAVACCLSNPGDSACNFD